MSSVTPIDPVTVEILRNGFIAVTEEMKINLTRTAYNMIIYEALDFTVGIFTATGETISIGLGLPMFIRGMSATVKAKIAHIGIDGFTPGDILITNDAYLTGSHLNHITLTMPVFHEGELIAFTCCMAHWIDIGGTLGGVTTDIYSEGLQIPILKYSDAGKINTGLVDLIMMNVRTPDLAAGDLRAQVAAVMTGERRLSELAGRYGAATVVAGAEVLMRQADAAARVETRSIPNGVYEAESFMDDDGISIGTRIPIRVRVVVEDDEMTIDLSGISPQVRGFYNSGISTGIACAQVAFKCLTTPTLYPINDGAFRPLKVIMPVGTVVSAVRPAPMRWWMTFPMTVIDTIFKAVAPAIPHRTIAGHYADLVVAAIHGIHPKTGRFYIGALGPPGGGWGAKQREDGVSATICINDGDTHNSPIEQLEIKYPLVVDAYALRADSGGAGRQRGGLGLDFAFHALAPMTVSTMIERVECPPWGLQNGRPGSGNGVGIWSEETGLSFGSGKVSSHRLGKGEPMVLRSGGGGGFGDPRERDPKMLAEDLEQGYVTPAEVQRAYFLGAVGQKTV